MLWLALYFPQLPIDRQQSADTVVLQAGGSPAEGSPAGGSPDTPRAVVLQAGSPAGGGTRRRILASNACAAAAGVHAGMALKNAYALVPDLHISDYNEAEQIAHLELLTLWALQYSSTVVPEPPDTLLIEIQASLKLFGGLNSLLENIGEQLRDQSISVCPGIAPTPAAATLFTRAGIRKVVRRPQAFRDTLASVNVAHLPLNEFTFKGLRQSGIHTLGELQKIPPAALTRRFGKDCTNILYKLDGRLPDPREPYRATETFSQSVDLPLEAPDTQALGFPLKRLLGSLGGFLKARDLGIQHLDIHLYHHRLKPQNVELKFLNATADMIHLLRVATERLGTLTLEAPITRLALVSVELASMEREGRDLFHKSQSQNQSVEQVLDKLVARLGKEAVYTALPEDDHRPEKAWLTALLNERCDHQPWPARPLWLLTKPRVLDEPITLHTLPERIENGWWDEADVRRDYFIGSNKQGAYYWLYRLRHQPDQWWIHGLFA